MTIACGNGFGTFQAGTDGFAFQKIVNANIGGYCGGILAVKVFYYAAFAVFDSKIKGITISFDEAGYPVRAKLFFFASLLSIDANAVAKLVKTVRLLLPAVRRTVGWHSQNG